MLIGTCCFKDAQIVSMITSYDKIGKCNITGIENVFIYDTDSDTYLIEYFEPLIDVFTSADKLPLQFPKDKLSNLKDILFKWKIFSINCDCIQKIITAICKQKYIEEPNMFDSPIGIKDICNTDYMNHNALLKTFSWNEFSYYIRHVNRYHSGHINLEKMDRFFSNMIFNMVDGIKLYRSRIGNADGFDSKDMGAPPIDVISVGRANSRGIQCLYLADNIVTTFHEIKATELDYVTVGEFELKRNKKLRIVDLSYLDSIGPFSNGDFNETWFAVNIENIRSIGDEIAKPIRRYDSELDYLPTQYICDFIKHLGYDGIKYKSTLDPNGNNYAIFNESNFKCTKVRVCHINSLVYDYLELQN